MTVDRSETVLKASADAIRACEEPSYISRLQDAGFTNVLTQKQRKEYVKEFDSHCGVKAEISDDGSIVFSDFRQQQKLNQKNSSDR